MDRNRLMCRTGQIPFASMNAVVFRELGCIFVSLCRTVPDHVDACANVYACAHFYGKNFFALTFFRTKQRERQKIVQLDIR